MFKSFGKSETSAPPPVNGESAVGMDAANKVTSTALKSLTKQDKDLTDRLELKSRLHEALLERLNLSVIDKVQTEELRREVANLAQAVLAEEKQTLPFSIWSCEELLDEPCGGETDQQLAQTQAKILRRLLVITHDNDQAQEMLRDEHWQQVPARVFSFSVAGLLGMDPETSQALLEMTRPQQRLDTVLEMLNELGAGVSG